MCGIAGILSFNDKPQNDNLDKMLDCIKHRGPDDEGTFIENRVAFGMRRLSIIDINSGHQPIFNEDRSLAIVFNGEIYNYRELRKELSGKGHSFSSESDTEVIVHLYEEYGKDCVKHLNGMFAFAIWDNKKQSLFIARDRFGIKPLYYSLTSGGFLFGSEIKCILAHPAYSKELSLEALPLYFTYLYIPGETTFFNNINKLLPGHFLTISGNTYQIEKYYSPIEALEEQTDFFSEAEVLQRFNELFSSAVQSHLISDVPLGAFLSGGVDSSLIVATMRKFLDKQVQTFTVGYEEGGEHYDERIAAREISKRLGTKHEEFVVSTKKVTSILPQILNHLDEPIGDASIIPTYLISQFARSRVTVALSGTGGDEIAAGYERHLWTVLAERFSLFSKILSSSFSQKLTSLIPDSSHGGQFPERMKRFSMAASLDAKERYFKFIAKQIPTLANIQQLSSGKTAFNKLWETFPETSLLNKILLVDKLTYLPDDLLMLADQASMANSLEIRVPFLDHRLSAFMLNLPDSYKVKGFTKKYLLKRALEQYLPKSLIYQKKKGFSVPLSIWFRTSLRPLVSEHLSKEGLSSIPLIDASMVGRLIEEHMSGKRKHDEIIFALLTFKIWHKRHFEL